MMPGATLMVVGLAVILSVVSLSPQVNARELSSGGGSNSGSGKTPTTVETEHGTEVESEHGTEVETEHATEVEHHSSTTEVHKSGDDAAKRTAAETAARAARQAEEQTLKARQDAAKEKLSAAKLKICNNRKANIDNRVARISDRVSKHLTLFNTISERAQAFYTAKGNTLASYDSLVADVAAKKATAQTAVDAANAKKTSFSCDVAEPKLAIEAYKLSVTEANAALKDYRAAIKTLIAGIKSVNPSTDNSTKSTGEAQ